MATVCPYCNIEVSESSIEAEDGCCPECGAIISATSSFLDDDDIAEYNDMDEEEVYDEDDDDLEEDDFQSDDFEDFDEEFDEEFDDEDDDEDEDYKLK